MISLPEYHLSDVRTVLEALGSGASGLTEEEARARLEQYGRNELQGKKGRSRLVVFISQFRDLMVLLLIVAAVVSLMSGERVDALVIVAIIIGNAIIGYSQEYRSERSIEKLQQMASSVAVVLRSGSHRSIDAATLVPGDVILLEAGNVVPADARLMTVHNLKAAEAALTGESAPVSKTTAPLSDAGSGPGDRTNMVFKGTGISHGSGTGVVTGTGMRTEMGAIAGMLGGPEQQTPLQKRLTVFGRQLAFIVIVICAVIFGLGLLKGEPVLGMFLTAMSLAVAALPEALPVIVTIALSRGAARMVDNHALVRRLTAVETLGSVGFICSDKTGTLTQNRMTVEHIEAIGGGEPLLLQAMALNNEVKKGADGALLGDPTETALIDYAAARGLDPVAAAAALPLAHLLPFDSERMLMTTVHRQGDRWIVLVKGAPARVLEQLHSRQEGIRELWQQRNRDWAAKGHRVLFFAFRALDAWPDDPDAASLEVGLDFLGMACLIDPPRGEVVEAIQRCHESGIATVMITGDQALTAASIARRLRIIRDDEDRVVSGAELGTMDEEALRERAARIRVYARVSPEQKLRIVRALQEGGHAVAMTGDGVNDAPSLKQADIGIAMGITGTDVAKEASHMILLDDNFASIVSAVKEGRRIYDNIRKFVQYILACNLGELLTILAAPLLGLPIPLLPIHILWINLVTDGLPGIAMATEPAEGGIMSRAPRPAGESLFSDGMIPNILSTGAIMAAAALLTQFLSVRHGYSVDVQQTMVFTVLCLVQLGNALSVRAGRHFLLHRIGGNPFLLWSVGLTVLLQAVLIAVPFLNRVFKIARPDTQGILMIAGITGGSVLALQGYKWIERRITASGVAVR